MALLIKQPPLYFDIQPHGSLIKDFIMTRFHCTHVSVPFFVVVQKQVRYMYNIIAVIM